ncbi:MAG TPA: hypothetical protein VK211_16645 [Kamptonema sp.]|nr:hypothetical protein [Kamptonema sp.]
MIDITLPGEIGNFGRYKKVAESFAKILTLEISEAIVKICEENP